MSGRGQDNPKEKIVVQIDPDLEELIPTYLGNRRKDVEAIRKALGEKDLETIERLGHTMKGSGGGYGFDITSAIGANLEQAAKENSLDEIKSSLNELADFMDRVQVVY